MTSMTFEVYQESTCSRLWPWRISNGKRPCRQERFSLSDKSPYHSGRHSRILWTSLLLGLEFAVVFPDERLDLRSAGKNAKPLFLVEGDGETSHSVEGYGTFLADLETQPC